MKKEPTSALVYVLKGLLPYTRQNMLLTFKPKTFFAELEKTSGYKKNTLQTAMFRGQKRGLITDDVIPKLTARGRQKLQPFVAQKLSTHAKLMVIFDIPEATSFIRRQFRLLLRNLEFSQVQQSVWTSSYNHREIVEEAVQELGLEDCVQLYEADRIFPR